MGEVISGCKTMQASIKQDSTLYAAKIKNEKMTGKDLLTVEVKRHKAHRDLLTDWLYTEMEEHAKKLEIYSDLFNMFQNGIDVNDEFMEAMIAVKKFTNQMNIFTCANFVLWFSNCQCLKSTLIISILEGH